MPGEYFRNYQVTNFIKSSRESRLNNSLYKCRTVPKTSQTKLQNRQ